MLASRYQNDFEIEVGCDEAGRGCLAGPVVAAAVYLPIDYKNIEIQDSKKLNKKKRSELAKLIKKEALSYAIAHVEPEEIDKINILKSSILAMHRAIDMMDYKAEFLIIDGNKFYKYHHIPYKTIVKGDDKYLSIAAASILAKTARDDMMEKYHLEYPDYNFDSNKGYPSKYHREMIKKVGICPIHRKSFKLKELNKPLSLFG